MRWVKHSWIFFRSLRPLTSKSSLGNKCPLFQLWNSMLTFIICLIYHSENIFVCVLVWPDVAAIADSTVSRNNLALSFQKTIRHIFIYNLSMISSPRNKSERTNHAMNSVKRHKKHCIKYAINIDKVCDLLFQRRKPNYIVESTMAVTFNVRVFCTCASCDGCHLDFKFPSSYL